jgi:hypothetical protein
MRNQSTADGHYNGNGNGHHENGNGKTPAFQIKPATDPQTFVILDARRNALADERLTRSEKAAYCEILDRSLNPSLYDQKGRGIVTISDASLAELFRVTVRTIYTWKQNLIAAGLVWISKQFRPNMWPLTTYHISCLHRRPPAGKTDAEGTYGKSDTFRPPPTPGLGARRPGQRGLALPGTRTPAPPLSEVATAADPKNAEIQPISALARNALRLSAEEKIGSEPKLRSAQSRRKDRLRAEEKIGSEPKLRSAQSRSEDRPPTDPDFGHLQPQIRVTRGPEDKTVNRLTDNRAIAGEENAEKPAPRPNPRQLESENDFLAHLAQLSKREAEVNGGLWRLNFRQNKRKAWACLAEAKAMLAERRVKTTVGAALMDLWREDRLNYDKEITR